MEILLFAYIATLLFAQSSASLLVQREKLGNTVSLKLGPGVLRVKVALLQNDDDKFKGKNLGLSDYEKNYQYIVLNGKITDYGRERYGNRLSFENDTLKIRNLTANDAVTYSYFLYDDKMQPAAIDIVLE